MSGYDWIDILIALATVILGGGAITAVVTWMLNRHKPSIDREAAESSSQMTSVQMADKVAARALELAETANAQLALQEAKVKAQGKQLENQNKAIENLHEISRTQGKEIGQMRNLLSQWAQWAQNLHSDWPALRLREEPPELPTTLKY